MLGRVQRKRNPLTLLVGMQTSTATIENSVEIPKTMAIELPYTEETRTERVTCTPVFITALFTIARTWKQPRCPWAQWNIQFSSVHLLSHVRLFATPWIAACQAFLSITYSRSSLKLTFIESVMPSSHLILCCPLLLLPPIPPSIRVFSIESTLLLR